LGKHAGGRRASRVGGVGRFIATSVSTDVLLV
jgi:hypothetical protein